MADTPGALPSLTAETRVKTTAGTLWAAGSVLVLGVVMAVTIWFDVQTVKEQCRNQALDLKEVAKQVQDLRLQLAGMGLVSRPPSSGAGNAP